MARLFPSLEGDLGYVRYEEKDSASFRSFDNYVPHSDEKSLNRSLDSWLRNLAEQSNKTDKLIVLIATTDENFALRLHNLNNRVKFKYVDHCREFKWTKHEVLAFFNLVNVTLDDQQCDTATKAGTPDFCANYLKYLNGRRYVLPDPTASAEILDRAREDGRKIAFAWMMYLNNINTNNFHTCMNDVLINNVNTNTNNFVNSKIKNHHHKYLS